MLCSVVDSSSWLDFVMIDEYVKNVGRLWAIVGSGGQGLCRFVLCVAGGDWNRRIKGTYYNIKIGLPI